MNINTANYEEYALDYLEGSLSASDNLAMKQFLKKHPAILMELEGLQSLVLEPDPSIVFKDKASLKRKESTKVIPFLGFQKKWLILAAAMLIGVVCLMKVLLPTTISQPASYPNIVNEEATEQPATPKNELPENQTPPAHKATPKLQTPIQPIVATTKNQDLQKQVVLNTQKKQISIPNTFKKQKESLVKNTSITYQTPVNNKATPTLPKQRPIKQTAQPKVAQKIPVPKEAIAIVPQNPTKPTSTQENTAPETAIAIEEKKESPLPPQINENANNQEPIAMASSPSTSKKRQIKVSLFPKIRKGISKEKIKMAFFPEAVTAK